MDVRARIRGSESGTPPPKRLDTTRRSTPPVPPGVFGEPKRQHLMRVERVLQVHRDWVMRHGRADISRARASAGD
jgi:hypothetical protein